MPPYWDSTPVTFYRPDGDTEGKDIGWCRSHGFYEIYEGMWSGDWYYRHHPEEIKPKQVKKKQNQKESGRGFHRYSDIHPPKRTRDDYESDDGGAPCVKMFGRDTRSELLDTIYGGCSPPYIIAQARRDLAKLDGTLIKCPIGGCQETFLSGETMQKHLRASKGQAHISYREGHNISSNSAEPPKKKPRVSKVASNLPSKAKTAQVKTTLTKSMDIRSFFKPKSNNCDTG